MMLFLFIYLAKATTNLHSTILSSYFLPRNFLAASEYILCSSIPNPDRLSFMYASMRYFGNFSSLSIPLMSLLLFVFFILCNLFLLFAIFILFIFAEFCKNLMLKRFYNLLNHHIFGFFFLSHLIRNTQWNTGTTRTFFSSAV